MADLDLRERKIPHKYGTQRFVFNSYRIANRNKLAREVYARYGIPFVDLAFELSTPLHVHGHPTYDAVHFDNTLGRSWYKAYTSYLADEIERHCSPGAH
jgi:hypothetical protein